MVCKSEIGRFNVFLCPECDVLYCQKCAKTLADLENVCWVCEKALDESKPIKKISPEELLAYRSKKESKRVIGKKFITIFDKTFLKS